VHISSLHIDRFGVWTDLSVDDFSAGLNVIYGPNGSGKTTLVQFIRSVLFGFGDEIRERYWPSHLRGAGGSLTVHGPFGRQTISRHDDGEPLGRLAIGGADSTGLRRLHLQDLLAGIRPSVFDRVFTLGFAGPTEIEPLIDAALAHGFDLVGGDGDPQQLRTLKEQLEAKRSALAALTMPDGPLPELHARRRTLQEEIQTLQAAFRDHKDTFDRRLGKLAREISDGEERIEQLMRELSDLDSELATREADRRERDESRREARLQRERLIADRHQRLEEIDAQLERWQRVLHDIELRTRRLLDEAGPAGLTEDARDADPRHFLRLLETRLDELQKAVGELERFADPGSCRCRELRTMLGPALQSMRDDLYRLCNHLSSWEASAQERQYSSELGQLQRCEGELRQAIQSLTKHRQALGLEVAGHSQTAGVALDRLHGKLCRCQEHPAQAQPAVVTDEDLLDEERVVATDADICRLADRRRELQDDLEQQRAQLRRLCDEQRELRDQQSRECDAERLESHQLELRRIDQRIRDAEQRRQLESAIGKLETAVRNLEAAVRHPAILREASEFLARLTRGELRHMTISPERALSVRSRGGQLLASRQLSAGGRDHVCLALCLALVAAYRREGIELPVILSDVFLNIDTYGAQAAARLLCDFAQRGHQLFLFTRHEHIAALFRTLDVPVRELPSRLAPAPAVAAVPAPPPEEKELVEVNRQLSEIAAESYEPVQAVVRHAWNSEEFPGELTDRVRLRKAAELEPASPPANDRGAEYFLAETSPIQDSPSIDAATAERFRKIGVLLVRDLLRIDVEEAAEKLRHTGITASMIERWRTEALLVCRVPRLRPYDARILFACGIREPDQLAQLEAEELRRRVEALAATDVGRVLLQSGTTHELTRLTEWINSARRQRRTRPVERERYHVHERDRTPARETRRWTVERVADPRSLRSDGAHEPAERAPHHPPEAAPMVLKMDQPDTAWRFYLDLANSVEAAPSIGPRIAESLRKIGIVTVADLLKAEAATLVERLGQRRLTADRIRQWQQQATLACRIPQLRGHDAQLLVGCGVTDADQLAKQDAEALWQKVAAFSATNEGRRLLRGAKQPDRAEVSEWIRWANHARTLKAA
jgi:recombinational DNA repair ATPase RecF/predicted flap endonuclease-1-like 5' DNA nuclease